MVNILTVSFFFNNLTYCQHSVYMSSHDSRIINDYIPKHYESVGICNRNVCFLWMWHKFSCVLFSRMSGFQVVAIKMCLCDATRIIQRQKLTNFGEHKSPFEGRDSDILQLLWLDFLTVQCLVSWTEQLLNTAFISSFSSVTTCTYSCGSLSEQVYPCCWAGGRSSVSYSEYQMTDKL